MQRPVNTFIVLRAGSGEGLPFRIIGTLWLCRTRSNLPFPLTPSPLSARSGDVGCLAAGEVCIEESGKGYSGGVGGVGARNVSSRARIKGVLTGSFLVAGVDEGHGESHLGRRVLVESHSQFSVRRWGRGLGRESRATGVWGVETRAVLRRSVCGPAVRAGRGAWVPVRVGAESLLSRKGMSCAGSRHRLTSSVAHPS